MKRILLALAVTFAVLLPSANAVAIDPNPLPFLGYIRQEVTNQLTIQSNLVAAATNKTEAKLPKSLLTKLKSSLRTIDRTKTNYAAGAKSLSLLNRTLSRSALSNEFNPLINATFDRYLDALNDEIDDAEDRIGASYPGKSQDAANKALAKWILLVEKATTNANFLKALSSLGLAAKAEAIVEKAVTRAEAAIAPPAGITFSTTGSVRHSGKTTGAVIAYYPFGVGNFVINGGQATFKPIGLRTVTFAIYQVPEGYSEIPLNEGSYVWASYNPFGGEAYGENTTGVVKVTRNSVTKLMYGTFEYTCVEQDNPAKTITIKGSFSGTWQ